MEKKIINPWQWQDALNYVQAVEVTNAAGTLYVSGQAAVHSDGTSSNADMRTQLLLAIENLEKVIDQAGYECKNIVRLTVYSTSEQDFFANFDVFQDWTTRNEMKQAITVMQVQTLYKTLKVELEATVVK